MQLLISFRWVRGEAEAQGITVTRAEVRAEFREQKRGSFRTRKDYEEFLRRSGQSERDILRRVELDLLSNKLRERVTSDVAAVSDEDIERYYERNRARFKLPERRDLLVVLSKTRREAAAARARIEAGERWRTVAKDVSIDKASRSRGGKLRGVTEGQSERALNRALFAAERGELRGPLRTRFGWYVFKVTKIKRARQQPLEEVRRTIARLLRSQREQQALDTFVRGFTRRWSARTFCRRGYRISDCANGSERAQGSSAA
jgi:foldase protein PrsA